MHVLRIWLVPRQPLVAVENDLVRLLLEERVYHVNRMKKPEVLVQMVFERATYASNWLFFLSGVRICVLVE